MLPDALFSSAADGNGARDRFAHRDRTLAKQFAIRFARLRPPIDGGLWRNVFRLRLEATVSNIISALMLAATSVRSPQLQAPLQSPPPRPGTLGQATIRSTVSRSLTSRRHVSDGNIRFPSLCNASNTKLTRLFKPAQRFFVGRARWKLGRCCFGVPWAERYRISCGLYATHR